MKRYKVIRATLITGALLLVPLVAMQVTDEVQWGLEDFVVMGALVFGALLAYEYIAAQGGTRAYRGATAIAVGTSFLLIWVNLAVGIIGNEDNPANVLYLGVLAIGALGAIVTRLAAHGLSRVLFAMAAAQLAVPVIAFFIWQPGLSIGVVQVMGVNAFFALLWVASGILFMQASYAE